MSMSACSATDESEQEENSEYVTYTKPFPPPYDHLNTPEGPESITVYVGEGISITSIADGTYKPMELKTPEDWAKRYGIVLKQFSIVTGDKTYEYKFRDSGLLNEWIYSEFNTDGWYSVGKNIISSDGKWCVSEYEPLANGNVYKATAYSGKTHSEEEREEYVKGVVYQVKSCTLYRLVGLRLDGDKALFDQNNKPPTLHDVRYVFEVGETISVYADTPFINVYDNVDVSAYVFSHNSISNHFNAIGDWDPDDIELGKFWITSCTLEKPRARYDINAKMTLNPMGETTADWLPGTYDLLIYVNGALAYYSVLEILLPGEADAYMESVFSSNAK